MAANLEIATASLTDVGLARSENQDFWGEFEAGGERLLIVADGMGGHRGGATASRFCVDSVATVFKEASGPPEERLRRGLGLANGQIYRAALHNPQLRGMGTTAVALLFSPPCKVWIGWIGDSRAYLARAGSVRLLTRDHSLVADWIRGGILSADEAESHPRRNELTRAIGSAEHAEADVIALEVQPGDTLMLCSDGLWGSVEEEKIGDILASMDPAPAARALVDAANANGGPDNITIQILGIGGGRAERASPRVIPTVEPEASGSTEVGVPAHVGVAVEQSRTPPTRRSIFHVSSALVGAALAALVLSVGVVITSLRPGPQHTDEPSSPAAQITEAAVPWAGLEAEPSSAAQAETEADTLRRLEGVLMGGVVLLESMAPATPGEILPEEILPEEVEPTAERSEPAPRLVPTPEPSAVRRVPPSTPVSVDMDELEPRVKTFVDTWLEALRTADHSLYASLGFREPASEFERAYETRESFRLVNVEVVDVGQNAPFRVYLRIVVSYVFERPDGRFRTEDTHRVILEDGPEGMRVSGSWQ